MEKKEDQAVDAADAGVEEKVEEGDRQQDTPKKTDEAKEEKMSIDCKVSAGVAALAARDQERKVQAKAKQAMKRPGAAISTKKRPAASMSAEQDKVDEDVDRVDTGLPHGEDMPKTLSGSMVVENTPRKDTKEDPSKDWEKTSSGTVYETPNKGKVQTPSSKVERTPSRKTSGKKKETKKVEKAPSVKGEKTPSKETLKKKMAKPAASSKTLRPKAKEKEGAKRSSADSREEWMKKIPADVLEEHKKGCSTCRGRSYCCRSCWVKRGFL